MTSIFSKIIAWEISAQKIYEDEAMIAIYDIAPQAKTHILIIPKKEIPTINDITPDDTFLLWNMIQLAKQIAQEKGISEGYQLKFHVGTKGWQEVWHIHLHLTSDI